MKIKSYICKKKEEMEQYAEVNQKNQKNFYKNVFICSFIFTDYFL